MTPESTYRKPAAAARLARAAALTVCAALIAGCSAIYRDHGYVPPAEDLEQIVLGVDTRDSIVETAGAPALTGLLENGDLYYIASRTRTIATRRPEVIEREVVAINFDASGIARNIERYRLEDGRTVPLNRRITDSSLRDQTFLRQLLGNLGRFAPGDVLAE